MDQKLIGNVFVMKSNAAGIISGPRLQKLAARFLENIDHFRADLLSKLLGRELPEPG